MTIYIVNKETTYNRERNYMQEKNYYIFDKLLQNSNVAEYSRIHEKNDVKGNVQTSDIVL